MTKASHLKTAVALKYNLDEGQAPSVTAKGQGYLGEQILKIAQENGIPIQQDPELTGALAQLEINQQIPQELYLAVAEILSFFYELKENQLKRKK